MFTNYYSLSIYRKVNGFFRQHIPFKQVSKKFRVSEKSDFFRKKRYPEKFVPEKL